LPLLPPPNESATDHEKRLRAEEEAKKINDDIDEMLKAEPNESRKKVIKVFLLGQSEGGKSTTLKRTSMSVVCSSTPFAHSNPHLPRISAFTYASSLPHRTHCLRWFV